MITRESVNTATGQGQTRLKPILRAFSRQVIQSYKLMLSFHGMQLVNSETGLLGRAG